MNMNVKQISFLCKEGQIMKQPVGLFKHNKRLTPNDHSDSLQLGCPTTEETTKKTAVSTQENRDFLFHIAVQECHWPWVVMLVQGGVSVNVRDNACVHHQQWNSFIESVNCGLKQSICKANKLRIREFAFEKAVASYQEEYIVRALPEKKLPMEVLQQITQRVVRGPAEVAVVLMVRMGHSNFTEHVWAQAIAGRHWEVLQRHVRVLLLDRKLYRTLRHSLLKISSCRKWIHGKLCFIKGPLRAHGADHCLVYESVIMLFMRETLERLYEEGAQWKSHSTRDKRNFDILSQSCENTEFFLDLFLDFLKRAAEHNFAGLFSFILNHLPPDLVDNSKTTSWGIAVKAASYAANPRRIMRSVHEWIDKNLVFSDSEGISEVIKKIFLNNACNEVLPVILKFGIEKSKDVHKFLWQCHKALLKRQGDFTDNGRALNNTFKDIPLGTQNPLVLSLHSLSVKEWSTADNLLVAFCGPQLVDWCKDRRLANVAFFVAFLMKHAGCKINWQALLDISGNVTQCLLLDAVNYAVLDGDSASAVSMLQRCSWDSVTLRVCQEALRPLLLERAHRRLSSLITACKYKGAHAWGAFLRYEQLKRDESWVEIAEHIHQCQPADPALCDLVCREAVSGQHWKVVVRLTEYWCKRNVQEGIRKLGPTMKWVLTRAVAKGQMEGAACALKLVDLGNYVFETPPSSPSMLLSAGVTSPSPVEMTKLFIAAGAPVVQRRVQTGVPDPYTCAMTCALINNQKQVIVLLYGSGACSNARLFQLDTSLRLNSGWLGQCPIETTSTLLPLIHSHCSGLLVMLYLPWRACSLGALKDSTNSLTLKGRLRSSWRNSFITTIRIFKMPAFRSRMQCIHLT